MQKAVILAGLHCLFLSSSPSAYAQTGWGVGADTGTLVAPPLVRLWNWPDTTFMIGAWGGWQFMPPSDQVADLWDFLDAMGIDMYFTSFFADTVRSIDSAELRAADSIRGLHRFDTLLWSADVAGGDRLVFSTATGESPDVIGAARELQFYPFDSVQSPYFPFRFHAKDGGEKITNPFERDDADSTESEMRYDSSNTTSGTVVAQEMAFNRWPEDLRQVYRWKAQTASNDSLQDATRWRDQ